MKVGFCLLFIILLPLSACSKKIEHPLIGLWKGNIGERIVEFNFYDSKKITYFIGDITDSGTWNAFSATKVSIISRSDNKKIIFDYHINGNILTLTENGRDETLRQAYVLDKQKVK